MASADGHCLAFAIRRSDTRAQRWVEGDNTLSVAASRLLSQLTSRCPRRGLGSCLPSSSDASQRRCDASKCQTARCRCRLLWSRVFIREKQLSPRAWGLRRSSGGWRQREVSCSVPWPGTRHWDSKRGRGLPKDPQRGEAGLEFACRPMLTRWPSHGLCSSGTSTGPGTEKMLSPHSVSE